MSLAEYGRRLDAVMKHNVPRIVGRDTETEEAKRLPWKCVAKRFTGGAYEYAYQVPSGFSIKELERHVDAFYAACGCAVELQDRAGVVVVRVFPDDFPDKIPYSPEFLKLTEGREVVVGFDRTGKPITHNFRVPHQLVAGMSGYGKTDYLRWLLLQLISRFTPQELSIDIIDMKGFSFLPFRNVPHVRVVRDLSGAVDVLQTGAKLMRDRSKEIWDSGDRSLTDRYQWKLIIIDEAAQIAPDLMPKGDDKDLAKLADEAAAQIAGVGREVSVGLFYCTQRPDSEVINPLVKANCDATFCFKTKTESNSMIVLDRPGAEKLPHKKPGRGLYATDDLVQVLVPYVGKDEAWDEVLRPYIKEKDADEGSQEENHPRHDEGHTDYLDGASLELLQREWLPGETGVGSLEGTGTTEADRGEKARDRKEQSMAPILRWTFPS